MQGARALSNEKRGKKANGAHGPDMLRVEQAEACLECTGLRAELVEAKKKRDTALLDLAREREAFNALRLAFLSTQSGPLPPFQPDVVPPAPPPLRYVLADRANEKVKRYLKPMHSATKRMAETTLKLLKRGK